MVEQNSTYCSCPRCSAPPAPSLLSKALWSLRHRWIAWRWASRL